MRLPQRSPRALIVASAVLVLSCSSPTGMCACPPATYDALAYGTVTAPDGTPVADAFIVAEAGTPGCAEQLSPLGQGRSGTDGRYRAYLRAPSEPKPGACLRVRAAPPKGSVLRAPEPIPFAVRFTVDRATDSVRVDVVLR